MLPRLRTRMIAEGANGPTSLEADGILWGAWVIAAAGHPYERGRRDRLLLRMGTGPRPALLDSGRDPREARRETLQRVRPRVGSGGRAQDVNSARRRSSPAFATSRMPYRRAGSSVRRREHRSRRDGLAPGAALGRFVGPGQQGELLQRPEVRAVYVTEEVGSSASSHGRR